MLPANGWRGIFGRIVPWAFLFLHVDVTAGEPTAAVTTQWSPAAEPQPTTAPFRLIAPIDTVQLTPGAFHRSNFCDRQFLVESGNLTLPLALEGMDISAQLMRWTPLHVRVGADGALDGDDPGFLVNVMDNIAQRGRFRWRESFGVGLVPADDYSNNATFSEILTWGLDTYDVSIGEWRNSVSRKGRSVLFPLGMSDASIVMVQSRKENSFNTFDFLRPFRGWVWVAIFVTYIISGFVYYFIHVYGEGEYSAGPKMDKRECLYDSFMALNQQNSFKPKSTAGRLFTFSINFFSMVIIASYTANLVSFLVLEQQPVHQASTFREAELKKIPICVWKGTAAARHLRTKYPAAILVETDSTDMEYEYLNAGLCGIVSDSLASWRNHQRNDTVNGRCQLAQVGDPDVIQSSGLAVKSDSGTCTGLLLMVLDYHLSDMWVEKVIDREKNKHLNLIAKDFCIKDTGVDDDNPSLKMEHLGGIFLVHVGLMMVALAICQYEHMKNMRTRKERNKINRPQSTVINRLNDTTDLMTNTDMSKILDQFKDKLLEELALSRRSDSTVGTNALDSWESNKHPLTRKTTGSLEW